MMKKIMLFAAACIALVACTKNIDNATPTGRQVTISATVQIPSEYATKVSPDASSLSASTITFHWEAGDKVVLSSNDFTEMQLFTIVDASINGTTANFTGTALSDMSSYKARYCGKNTSIEKVTKLFAGTIDSLSYDVNDFHPYIFGSGNADGFTLNDFNNVINIPLKGDATIGKIDYYTNSTLSIAATMSFGTGLTLTNTETPVYMPLFVYTSDGFSIKIYDTDDQLLLEKVSSDDLTSISSTLVKYPALEVKAIPEGALSGVFSVSATTKVRFSKGNLYYDGSAFKFEDNQYSFANQWNTNHVSHFFWSKDESEAYCEDYDGEWEQSTSDVFFTNDPSDAKMPNSSFTVAGQTGIWRTLKGGNYEWMYLLNYREVNGSNGEGYAYQFATIRSDVSGGVPGLIIYPDNYTSQTGDKTYSSEEWSTMESAGCVFLPSAGYRSGSAITEDTDGYYWASSASTYFTSSANSLYFSLNYDEVNPQIENTRSTASSVRLVTAAQ